MTEEQLDNIRKEIEDLNRVGFSRSDINYLLEKIDKFELEMTEKDKEIEILKKNQRVGCADSCNSILEYRGRIHDLDAELDEAQTTIHFYEQQYGPMPKNPLAEPGIDFIILRGHEICNACKLTACGDYCPHWKYSSVNPINNPKETTVEQNKWKCDTCGDTECESRLIDGKKQVLFDECPGWMPKPEQKAVTVIIEKPEIHIRNPDGSEWKGFKKPKKVKK